MRTAIRLTCCFLFLISANLLFAQAPTSAGKNLIGWEDAKNISESLEKILYENIIPFWYPQTIDQESGGYRLNHDYEGKYQGPGPKSLVTQTRTVWFFSYLYRNGYGKAEHLAAARHGYEFLVEKMRDPLHGGYFWEVDASGETPTKPDKHLYGQSFALYALSEYATASGDREALRHAQELFNVLEYRAYDRENGGYIESFTRDWQAPPADSRNYMSVTPDVKLMNTHLHLMEAFTTYYRATNEPLARERLIELVRIESNTVVRKWLGACTDKFTHSWKPLRGPNYDVVSYGHDVENIWLLIDACDALGVSNMPLMDLYDTLFDYSLKYGYDEVNGGFYNTGPFNEPATDRTKVWWVQSECLVTPLEMYRLTGNEKYYRIFRKTLDWIMNHQVDWKNGDWHANVSEEGKSSGGKAHAWKSPYHNGRAVIRCLETLKALRQP